MLFETPSADKLDLVGKPFKKVHTVLDLHLMVSRWKDSGETIALVPTMGGIHDGHLSLIAKAQSVCDRVIASLFVNPTQFGENDDFETYPMNEKMDTKMLRGAGVDLLFLPSLDEIYPKGFSTSITVSGITNELCGAHRPGHFSGVATVVAKLLLQILPDVAIFGEKDYQQLMVIRQMVRDLNISSQIMGVPTKREKDGLAFSSRNLYLTVKERIIAPKLYRVLCTVAEVALKQPTNLKKICEKAKEDLTKTGFSSVEYLLVCDSETLKPLEKIEAHARVFSAVRLGKARLIDNVPICF